MSDGIAVRLLGAGDADVLARVDPDVFDDPLDPASTAEFLADPRHHIAVAIDDGVVVGMVSAFNYVHPDKPNEFFIAEAGVADSHQRRGIGKRLMSAMLAHARARGCKEAWVATELDNTAARALYSAVGGKEDSMVYVTFDLDSEK